MAYQDEADTLFARPLPGAAAPPDTAAAQPGPKRRAGHYGEIPSGPDFDAMGALQALGSFAPGGWFARILGAAGGRGMGRGATNVGERKPIGTGVAKAIGEGAQQQATGEALGGVARGASRLGIAGSLSSRGRQLAQAVGEAEAERLPVGGLKRGLPPGARHIPIVGPSLVRGSRAAVANFGVKNAAREAANAAGPAIPAKPMMDEALTVEREARVRSDKSDQLRALYKRFADFADVWKSGSLPSADAQKFLTSLGEEAKPLYEAAGQRGVRIAPADNIVAQQAKRFAAVLDKTMDKMVAGHEATTKALSSAIAAKDAINASESLPGIGRVLARTGVGSTVGAAVGGALNPDRKTGIAEGAAVGMGLANSPAVSSRLALLLSDPSILAVLRRAPWPTALPDRTRTQ